MGYPIDQPTGPIIEAPVDLVCPECKDPDNGIWSYEITAEYDGDENGVRMDIIVVKWECNCGHIFDASDTD